eukprot:2414501-Pyramimonas_sp.AAC.2
MAKKVRRVLPKLVDLVGGPTLPPELDVRRGLVHSVPGSVFAWGPLGLGLALVEGSSFPTLVKHYAPVGGVSGGGAEAEG